MNTIVEQYSTYWHINIGFYDIGVHVGIHYKSELEATRLFITISSPSFSDNKDSLILDATCKQMAAPCGA